MEEKIDGKISQAKQSLDIAKGELDEIKNLIIKELKNALPNFLNKGIGELVEKQHEIVITTPEEVIKKMKEELRQVISKKTSDAIRKMQTSDEWYKCREYEESHSNGISTESGLWRDIKSIASPIAETLEKYKFNTPIDVFGDYEYITPHNLSFLGESSKDLDEKLARKKEEYCKFQKNFDELVIQQKKQLARKKWESISS